MNEIKEWNIGAANTSDELLMIIESAASGIKTQVIASPVLSDPRLEDVKEKLNEIATELRVLSFDYSMLAARMS